MKFKVKLRLIDANGKKHKYSLNLEEGSKFTLGRGTPGIGAELNHPTVSTAHCHLHIKDGVLHVMDNKSRNGTRLNGKSVQTAGVRVGDMLQLGVCQIEFLEAPNPPIEENPASTRFIDINELSPEEAKAMGKNKEPLEERAPEPTMAMSRKSLGDELARSSVERESTRGAQTATGLGERATGTIGGHEQHTDEPPETDEEPMDYANDAYAPPAPALPGESHPAEEVSQQSFEAPPIPERPMIGDSAAASSAPVPGDDLFRSLDSFGRGREGEYRREDDPRYNPDARGRREAPRERERERETRETRKPKVSDRETDTIAKPIKAARAKAPSNIDQHQVISAAITLASTAAAGTLLSIGKGTYAPWMTPLAGIVGTALVYSLAWLLHKYNEFMEAEGETRDYFRFLAYSTVALVPTSLLTNTAIMWRLAAFIGLGVAFFHLFMAKFKPVAEKFVFLVGSYVSVLALAGYLVNGQALTGSRTNPNQRGPRIVKQDPPPQEEREPAGEDEETPEAQPEEPQEEAQAPTPAQTSTAQTTPPVEPAQPTQPQKIEVPSDKQTTQSGKKPGGPDSFAISQLYKAAEHGDTDIVRKLIREKGVNPNTVAENGVTALMLAAYYGHVETARYLLGEKADINLKDRQGTTALMWAVLKGNRDMVAVLVQAGADLDARRNDGDTALEIARMWHYNDIVRILDRNPKSASGSNDRNTSRKPSAQPVRRAQPQKSRPQAQKSRPKSRKKNSRYSATEEE